MIDDARRFSASGNHEQAAAALLEAARSAGGVTPSLRMAITEEYRTLRRWRPTALHARLCVREASDGTSDLRDRANILARCRAILREAEEHVGRVTLILPTNVPRDAVVAVGEPIAQEHWTDSVLVTPGAVRVTVEASGYRTFTRELTVTEGQAVDTHVEFEPRPPPGAEPGHVATEGSPTNNSAPSGLPATGSPSISPVASPGPGVGPWVLIATGAALGAAGAVTTVLLRQDAESELLDLQTRARNEAVDCGNRQRCVALEQRYEQSTQEPRERRDAMNILFGVSLGVAAGTAIGGLVWYFTRPRQPSVPPRVVVFGVLPSAAGATLNVGGTF